ncbi:MAG: hypothetical protein U0793_11880 [Gemmataceae bacterium]
MRRDIDRLAGETFDLLVVGGGITGAGVALDTAKGIELGRPGHFN